MLRLSQSQLTLLEYCPRRFQHTVLESLSVPSSPELLEAQQWGNRFHLLMQQREMGLPISPVLQADEALKACVHNLEAQAPQLFDQTGEIARNSEQERSLILNGYWFTVVYDLLRQWRDRAEIVDWKTYLRPRKPDFLRKHWQTRLYLYVLAETTPYPPEQIAMTYWFVRAENPETGTQKPQQVNISYSTEQHEKTRQDLTRLTNQLNELLSKGLPFPQIPVGSQKCEDCPFAVRCQRGFVRSQEAPELPSLEEIAEIPI